MHRSPLSPRKLSAYRVPRPGSASLLLILAPVLVMLLVWQQASVDRLQLTLDGERDLRQGLQSRVNALSLEANRLSSLSQVQSRAERELGLVRPGTDQIVDLLFAPVKGEQRFALRSLVGEANAGTRPGGNPQ